MGVTGFDNECRDGRSEPRNHCDLENLRWKTIGAKQKSTNFALAAVVLSAASLDKITPGNSAQDQEERDRERSNVYMSVVLWSVAALSAFKFLGALWFLIVRMFRGV